MTRIPDASDPRIVTLHEDYPHVDLDPVWIDHGTDRAADHWVATVPPRFVDAFAYHPEVQAWVRELVDQAVADSTPVLPVRLLRGPSLLLLGPTGTGKTFLAWGAIRALAVSGVHALWVVTTAAALYDRLRPGHGQRGDADRELDRVSRARLLVLDDLGAAATSEWVEETTYKIINYRYENQLPTVVTSNLKPSELAAKVGERVASRLVEMCRRVVLDGPDRRRAAAK